jgi:hypothetical protein
MIKLLYVAPLVLMTACTTAKLEGFEKAKVIDRSEVIQASKDCINAKMKPVIQSLPQKTDHGTIMFPVLVQCETYLRTQ